MKKYKALSLFILSAFFPINCFAQFFLNGAAAQINEDCFQLTPSTNNQVGSIWFEEKIDLNESFELLMELYFGCQNENGADGIVFGLQPVSTSVGQAGGGIGFEGVVPSIGIEFDTWQNTFWSDPPNDHITIIRDGILDHSLPEGSLAGPIQANVTNQNIEDCEYHDMRLTWEVETQTLTVFFDCEERLSYSEDLVNNIFNGDSEVFWGFTSATGGANNIHQVCFKYSTFLNGFEDVVICPGGQFQLDISGGDSYSWYPPIGLSDPNISDPIAAPEETTTYEVTVLDECNNPFTDELTVFVDGDTVFYDLGRDTILCELETLTLDATSQGNSSYSWSDGVIDAIREISIAGFYSVTVTIDDYCVSEDNIDISYLPLPYSKDINDTILCLNQKITLDVNIGAESNYLWSNGSTSPQIEVDEAGNYSVLINNKCGEAETNATIDFSDCQSLYIPSAFSPNDDGINDKFLIYSDGDIKEILEFKIFDRWGGLVYNGKNISPNSSQFAWDGTYKGKDLDNNIFVWYLHLIFKDDTEKVFYGDVSLLK